MEKSSPVKRFIAKWTNKDRVGYLFILPGVSVLFIFTIIPLLVSFIISLTNLDIFLAWPDMIGLDNFKRTLSDARVWNAFKNTFYYVIISVPVQLLVALILAYWLYKPTFFNKLCRSVFYVPVLCSFTAIGILRNCGFSQLRPGKEFDRFVMRFLRAEDPMEVVEEEVEKKVTEGENFYLYHVYRDANCRQEELLKYVVGHV